MLPSVERYTRTVVSGLLLAALAGCGMFSKDEEKEQGPAPLPEFKAEQRFDRVWSHGIGNGQGKLYNRLVPAIAGDMIVAAAAKGKVEAYQRITGRSLWNADVDAPLSGGVGIGCDLVFVAADDGRVFALSAADGKTQWKTQMEGQVLAPPQCDAGTVAVLTFNGHVVGLDAKSGDKRWDYVSTNPVLTLRASSTPLLYQGAVIAGFANGKVAAVDLDSGKPLWDARVGTSQGSSEIERQIDVSGDLLLSDNVLFAVSYQGRIAAMDVHSGRRLWERNASSYVGMSEGFNNVYVAGANGSITAFAKNDQGVRWEQTALARRMLSGTATWNNYVAVGDFEGYVHLLSQVDGHFVARERVDSDGVRVAPLVADDMLYVYGNSGELAAYRLEKK
jgi:outer membrane protein assembly factor BamB